MNEVFCILFSELCATDQGDTTGWHSPRETCCWVVVVVGDTLRERRVGGGGGLSERDVGGGGGTLRERRGGEGWGVAL